MGFLFALFVMLVIASIFSTPFLLFDALVRRQYKEHRAQWEMDGKPNCYLWRIEGFSWKRQFATGRCFNDWIRKTPDWVRSDPSTVRILFWLRFSYYTFFLLWVIGVVFAIRDIWIKSDFSK
jgi:hypothetical protein